MKVIEFTVADPVGLHARPVTKLVQEANLFKSDITLHYNGTTGDMKSIFGILGLAVPSNATVEIFITGSDEASAYTHFSTLIESF